MEQLTLEERVKRIEDELGLTDRDERAAELQALRELYKAHGFSGKSAKNLAHADWRRGVSLEEAEKTLSRRNRK